jgi:hypothetical protein
LNTGDWEWKRGRVGSADGRNFSALVLKLINLFLPPLGKRPISDKEEITHGTDLFKYEYGTNVAHGG